MIEKFIALVLPLLAMVVLLATDSDPAKKMIGWMLVSLSLGSYLFGESPPQLKLISWNLSLRDSVYGQGI